MRPLLSIILLTFLSCSNNPGPAKNVFPKTNDELKPYQRNSLDLLKLATANDIAYHANDSFRVWADGYVGDALKPYYITRIMHDGAYTYLFWKKQKDSFYLYNETAAPRVGFERDSLFDVNGDGLKDLVILQNSMNGHCQPQLANLYCFDFNKGEFVEITAINTLLSPIFHAEQKTITGEYTCKMIKETYKLKWANGFKLDTIFYKIMNL